MRSDLQHLDNFSADCEIMREVVDAGLLDPPVEVSFHNHLLAAYLDRGDEEFGEAVNSADKETAGISPKSIHFQQHSFGRFLHPSTEAPFAAWTVELARFHVPSGRVGVVKSFEQYLAQPAQLAFEPISYTQSGRWGIPGPWNTGNPGAIDDPGIWYFRLHNVHETLPARVNTIAAFPLPDVPYPDMPRETLLWYPAGSPAAANIHLVIPAGSLLRVFYVSPAQSVRLEVAAKLKGFIQSDRTPESAHNIRTNW